MSVRQGLSVRWLLAGVAVAALAPLQSAFAQSSATESVADVDEVIVTANKREERLVEVSASVSAVSGEELQQRQLVNIEDLSAQVSGLIVQRVSPVRQRIVLRGQNSGGSGATVATVIDDIPFTSSSSVLEGAVLVPDVDTFDLERVEVLRGPQGTLYGASAEGGLVKYVTRAPDLNEVQWGTEATAFTVEQGEASGSVKGYVNLPLMQDHVALRVSGYVQGIAGYVDNPQIGLDDVNGGYKIGGRASLLLAPSQDLTIRLTGGQQYTDVGGGSMVEVGGATFRPTDPPGNRFDPIGDYQHNEGFRTKSINQLGYLSANVDYDFDRVRLSSITSYAVFRSVIANDGSNGAAAPGGVLPGYDLGVTNGVLFGLLYFGGPPATARIDQTNRMRKFNQEFRIASQPNSTLFGNRFDWQIGAFYTRELGDFDQYFRAYPFNNTDAPEIFTGPPLPVAPAGGITVPNTHREVAGFADATYYFTPEISLQFGARYTETKQFAESITDGGLLYGFAGGSLGAGTATDEATTFSIAPRWNYAPDSMIYARVASGFRPGGINYFIPGAPPDFRFAFASDSTVNYEIGWRSQLFDDRLSVDVAAFYVDWTDIQVNALFVSSNGQTYSVIANAGEAVSQGLEWNLAYRPIEGLRLQAVGAYTNAELSAPAPGIGGADGDALAYVPDISNTLNVDYERPAFGGYDVFVGGSWTYIGERFTDFGGVNPIQGVHIELPSYNTFALQAGLRNGSYTFEVFARNITDEFAITSYGDSGGFNPTVGFTGLANIVQPRTIGLRFASEF